VAGGGTGQSNRDLVAELLSHAAGHGLPWVAGGDWQNDPSEVARILSEVPRHARPEVLAPSEHTHRSGPVETCIDFFAASTAAAALLGEVAVERGIVMAPHRAVGVKFVAAPSTERVTVQRAPTRVPTRRVYGPTSRLAAPPPQQKWGELQRKGAIDGLYDL